MDADADAEPAGAVVVVEEVEPVDDEGVAAPAVVAAEVVAAAAVAAVEGAAVGGLEPLDALEDSTRAAGSVGEPSARPCEPPCELPCEPRV